MQKSLKNFVKSTPLRHLHDIYLRLVRSRSQSNEGELISKFVRMYSIPKTFVEFGFHPHEFNCISLVRSFFGLLIDGDEHTVKLAQRMLPSNISTINRWLNLNNLDFIKTHFGKKPLGILSVDVDGNDYWFLSELISMRPALIVSEYNASFLDNPITVPYDDRFDRHAKHESGWYHGASLSALNYLCESNGYALIAVASGGCNAFFLRKDLLGPEDQGVLPDVAYAENKLRNKWSNTTAVQQWARIKNMPLVNVTDRQCSASAMS